MEPNKKPVVTINYVDGFFTKTYASLEAIQKMMIEQKAFIVTDTEGKVHIIVSQNITHVREN